MPNFKFLPPTQIIKTPPNYEFEIKCLPPINLTPLQLGIGN